MPMNVRATPTTTPRCVLMEEQLQKETWAPYTLQTPSVGEVCEYPKVSSFLNSYLVLELVYVLASCSIKKWEELPWWQHWVFINKNTVVSTLNVLLLTLNKALPGGRPRITRFIPMPISFWIMLNHVSRFLYLFSYALVWMYDWNIHS